MKRVYLRIGGLVRIARERQAKGSEIDKIVGKQVERNLKMVKRIISEEVIECSGCKFYCELPNAIDDGHISLEAASKMLKEGATGYCLLLKFGTSECGYCHMAERKR